MIVRGPLRSPRSLAESDPRVSPGLGGDFRRRQVTLSLREASLSSPKIHYYSPDRSVALARREGTTGAGSVAFLAITRQSAGERFKSAPPRLPPHVVARNRYLAEQRRTERLLQQIQAGAYRSADDVDGTDDETVAW